MKVLHQLLLLPALAPLLAVLLLAALNPRPGVSLRLLVWSSPSLPLGAWIAAAAAGGAGLSAAATALALRQNDQRARPAETPRQAPPRPTTPAAAAGPTRAPGEPPPTVAVPYRVIRRGSAATAPAATAPAAAAPAAAANDGWDQASSDDWN